MIKSISIAGVGLIGGSFARAIRAGGYRGQIIGYGRSEESLKRAVELGVIDSYELDLESAASKSELIMLAVPVGTIPKLLPALQKYVEQGTILTDAGSTKGSVVEAVEQAFGHLPASFVPGHPIAGTEKSGVEASFAELYQDRRVILTPTDTSSTDAVSEVRALWEMAGAEVVEMSVQHHDEVLAATSHLPHMLAFTLVDTLARLEDHDDIFRFAAGGFRDFTRIASSDPDMWHDICLNNRQALLAMIQRYSDELALLTEAISEGDGDAILQQFQRAKAARDTYCDNTKRP